MSHPDGYLNGFALCPVGDGNIYVSTGAKTATVLLKIDPEGHALWNRSIKVSTGYDYITHLMVDSEGMLLACGVSTVSPTGSILKRFVFRYDPNTDQLLWSTKFNLIPNPISGILEKSPGGNYLLGFSSGFLPREVIIQEIDRSTGLSLPGTSWRYFWGATSQLKSMVYANGQLYLSGFGSSETGTGGNRNALMRLDTASWQPDWFQLSPVSTASKARLDGEDVILDGDHLLSLYFGTRDSLPPALQRFTVFLQKTTLEGELVWLKEYDLTDFVSEKATEVVRVNDGYLIFGRSGLPVTVENGLFLLKTDFDGNAIWARKVNADAPVFSSYWPTEQECLEMDGFFYFTAYEVGGGVGKALLGKVDLNGNVGPDCAFVTATPVETYLISDAVVENPPVPTRNVTVEETIPASFELAGSVTLLPEILCENRCEISSGCDVKINECVKFELLDIRQSANGSRHYRVRFSNTCPGRQLDYLAIQLPNGATAVEPGDGTIYTAPGGQQYSVRNPNSSPWHSIRFRSPSNGIGNGSSVIFEYTLSPQSQPDYIHVFARMNPGPSYEAYLNVFNCPVTSFSSGQDRDAAPVTSASIFPNPTSDRLHLSFSGKCDGEWEIFNVSGQVISQGNGWMPPKQAFRLLHFQRASILYAASRTTPY
ncbi:MAG: hypothetical protein IPL65_05485 [Lewinellaceae bacterium]|nr:hypothetical protein [Lewinellaceae bacterium]